MEAFRSICQLAYSVPNFFVAEVPVQRFNEKDNDEAKLMGIQHGGPSEGLARTALAS